MTYRALYRVWRPRNFKDLVGQAHITKTLQNALEQKMFSHAYLFSGPRGTGKTSAAKIFAQAVNCEEAPTREPCQMCTSCQGILDGSISDVIEIDAASNTSVDDIREIRDKIKYASSAVPYKVYIIDEVHMISTSAFNALLKTLEEPPAHVIFILATTEPHKIPLTIISRCQRFDFKPIHPDTIVERLLTIIAEEKLDISKEALGHISLVAEGSMRDALSLLDQAVSYSDGSIHLEDVLEITGGVSQQFLLAMLQHMYERNAQQAIQSLDQMIQQGKDPGRLVFDLIYFLRDMLLYKSAPTLEGILDRASLDASFQEMANQIEVDWIQRAIRIFNDCQQQMKWTNTPKIFIEIAILSLIDEDFEQEEEKNTEATIALESRINQLEKEIQRLKRARTTAQEAPRSKAQTPKPKHRTYSASRRKIQEILQAAKKSSLERIRSRWEHFLTTLKGQSAPAHATIQDSQPVAASEDALIVAFKYQIHCSLFLEHQEIAQSALAHIYDQPMTILPVPVEQWKKIREDYIQEQRKEKQSETKEEDSPIVEEARKLVGEDLMNIYE